MSCGRNEAESQAAQRDAGALRAETLGRVLVVAPHPDDESIGCGGLLAQLRARGAAAFVLLLSDGEMSHPGSKRWPRAALAALRRSEFADALATLGIEPDAMQALGYPDGALPHCADSRFADTVTAVTHCLRIHPHDTLVVPWRRDPHPDHRSGSALARAANQRLARPMRVLEYMVWGPERGRPADLPGAEEARHWRLDISDAVATKLRAVAAHRSQCGAVIDDDPSGFTLSAVMRARCAEPWESYYEVPAAPTPQRA